MHRNYINQMIAYIFGKVIKYVDKMNSGDAGGTGWIFQMYNENGLLRFWFS